MCQSYGKPLGTERGRLYNEQMNTEEHVYEDLGAILDHPLVVAVKNRDYARAIELSCHESQMVCSAGLKELLCTLGPMPQQKSLELVHALCKPGGARVDRGVLRLCLGWKQKHLFGALLGHAIAQNGMRKTAEMLTVEERRRWISRLHPESADLIRTALENGQHEEFEKMLDVMERAKKNYPNGRTLIHSAVALDTSPETRKGRMKSVEMLVERGWSLDEANGEGNLPIHLVASVEMTRLLIELGADVRARGNRGNRPLYSLWLRREKYDSQGGNKSTEQEVIEIARLMIESGAQWKDAPTIDIMSTQIHGHALSEFLINGRRRHELGLLAGKTRTREQIASAPPRKMAM